MPRWIFTGSTGLFTPGQSVLVNPMRQLLATVKDHVPNLVDPVQGGRFRDYPGYRQPVPCDLSRDTLAKMAGFELSISGWLDPYPSQRQLSDRLILQQDNIQVGVAYLEQWMLNQGNWNWTVIPLPPAIVLVDRTVNANAPVAVTNLAAARITNPRILGNAPVVTGYRFIWGHDLELTGGAFRYVRHERRIHGQLYQVPFNPSGSGIGTLAIRWGQQVNQWRKQAELTTFRVLLKVWGEISKWKRSMRRYWRVG
ncbi:hypothetical protein B0H14DRAFT_3173614 [Mycena olivaceomarginata]|nr:hypothetical protein B0H14DRAFT_3173614 [Mycena olivaceomarginata]